MSRYVQRKSEELRQVEAVIEQQRGAASGLRKLIPNTNVDRSLFERQRVLKLEIANPSVEIAMSEAGYAVGSFTSNPAARIEQSERHIPISLRGSDNAKVRADFISRSYTALSVLSRAHSEALEREERKARSSTDNKRRRDERAARDRAQAEAYRDDIRDGAELFRKKLPRNHPCPYCGGPLGNDAQLDHIHPVSHGGQNTAENLVYACRSCNSKK